MAQLVFTDLDGTLLNHDDYGYEAALPMLKWLQDQQVPVIAVTSKTRLEVEELLCALSLHEPFVVENGSGIFIPLADPRFDWTIASHISEQVCQPNQRYIRLCLGCTYAQARQGLHQLSEHLEMPLQGFGDWSLAEVSDRTGLSLSDAQKAQAREFSEPFVNPGIELAKLESAVAKLGFQVLVGDRFCHLIGAGAGKGRAVQLLRQCYAAKHPQTPLITVGLGNSPNDLALLEVVDIPIVIPGLQGPHSDLVNRGWQVAPATGAQGWAMAMAQVCNSW
ncbi:MAG: HAD-IIB family hydrolase [Acaryochloris sp. SU_5_25]|nr:HAD-IIB family hydrolase [Acaryochloris sp. SU_5_25]